MPLRLRGALGLRGKLFHVHPCGVYRVVKEALGGAFRQVQRLRADV